MVTHDEHFGATTACCFAVELERPTIKPARPGLLVVVEAEPDVLELANLRVVLAPSQVDDVRYTKGAKLFGVVPGSNRATER